MKGGAVTDGRSAAGRGTEQNKTTDRPGGKPPGLSVVSEQSGLPPGHRTGDQRAQHRTQVGTVRLDRER